MLTSYHTGGIRRLWWMCSDAFLCCFPPSSMTDNPPSTVTFVAVFYFAHVPASSFLLLYFVVDGMIEEFMWISRLQDTTTGPGRSTPPTPPTTRSAAASAPPPPSAKPGIGTPMGTLATSRTPPPRRSRLTAGLVSCPRPQLSTPVCPAVVPLARVGQSASVGLD